MIERCMIAEVAQKKEFHKVLDVRQIWGLNNRLGIVDLGDFRAGCDKTVKVSNGRDHAI